MNLIAKIKKQYEKIKSNNEYIFDSVEYELLLKKLEKVDILTNENIFDILFSKTGLKKGYSIVIEKDDLVWKEIVNNYWDDFKKGLEFALNEKKWQGTYQLPALVDGTINYLIMTNILPEKLLEIGFLLINKNTDKNIRKKILNILILIDGKVNDELSLDFFCNILNNIKLTKVEKNRINFLFEKYKDNDWEKIAEKFPEVKTIFLNNDIEEINFKTTKLSMKIDTARMRVALGNIYNFIEKNKINMGFENLFEINSLNTKDFIFIYDEKNEKSKKEIQKIKELIKIIKEEKEERYPYENVLKIYQKIDLKERLLEKTIDNGNKKTNKI